MTKKIIVLMMTLFSLSFYAQQNFKAYKIKGGEFNIADFYNLIHKDTAHIVSVVKNKYFPSADYFIDGARKNICGHHAVYPPFTLLNKNMTVDVCTYENTKVYALEINFNDVNYVNDSTIIKQIEKAKFVKGSFYRIDDFINSEYIRKEDSLYIETKWKDNKIYTIKIK